MNEPTATPADLRPLNRRSYDYEQARRGFAGWHAPRLNRWERIRALGGTAVLERLEPAEIRTLTLGPEIDYWAPPGQRWRLGSMEPGASLEIAPHAQDSASTASPHPARASWLTGIETVRLADETALRDLLACLGPGERRLCLGEHNWTDAVRSADIATDGRLSWHPLSGGANSRFLAIAIHCTQPASLADYLGRDHALIEAALSAALEGRDDGAVRFRTALKRHVAFEEEILFPACEGTQAERAAIEELRREHRYIRDCLKTDLKPDSMRRLWRLLEAHDEKEEQIIYPRLTSVNGDAAAELLQRALIFPAATEAS